MTAKLGQGKILDERDQTEFFIFNVYNIYFRPQHPKLTTMLKLYWFELLLNILHLNTLKSLLWAGEIEWM